MTFKLARNYREYLNICKSVYLDTDDDAPFSDLWKWENFFDAKIRYNEDTGEALETIESFIGPIKNKPNHSEYPVIVAYMFDKSEDRQGKLQYRYGVGNR
jgi:hypothetical protein